MSTLELLEKWNYLLQRGSIINDILRTIGAGIMFALGTAVDALQYLYDKAFFITGLLVDESFLEYVDTWKPLFITLLACSLLFLAFKLMWNREAVKLKQVSVNLALFIIIITALPMFVSYLVEGVDNIIEVNQDYKIYKEDSSKSKANTVIKNNVIDLIYYDSLNFDEKQIKKSNNIDSADLRYLNYCQEANPYNFDLNYGDTLFHYGIDIVYDKDTKPIKVENYFEPGSITNLTPHYYYRFHVNWLSTYIELIALGMIFFFSSYKTVKLIMEIAGSMVLIGSTAAIDITNGQKTKQLFVGIFQIAMVLVFVSCIVNIYLITTKFLSSLDINNLARAFLSLFVSIACIDGPNFMERVFGYDAGLGSGIRSVASIAHTATNAVQGGWHTLAGRAAYDGSGNRFGGIPGLFNRFQGKDKNSSGPEVDPGNKSDAMKGMWGKGGSASSGKSGKEEKGSAEQNINSNSTNQNENQNNVNNSSDQGGDIETNNLDSGPGAAMDNDLSADPSVGTINPIDSGSSINNFKNTSTDSLGLDINKDTNISTSNKESIDTNSLPNIDKSKKEGNK